ncbi:MAG: sterol desaturase family protein [Chromatiales bacterium]|nr:sterol desaturase family protein [Chromatiales bacterium]
MIEREPEIYLLLYFAMICIVAILESLAPRRALNAPMLGRWRTNILVTIVDIAIVRLAFPVLAVGAALWARENGWGLFNHVAAPTTVAVVGSLVVMDVSRYWMHRLLHSVPVLWRLHRIHHSDPDYDFSTGLRFHPLEAVVSTAVDLSIVVLLGAPPLLVAVYGLFSVVMTFFAHANVNIPAGVDALVRMVFVTPDVHRTHHSIDMEEANSNFAAITPIWDRLFGTYRAAPALGHARMGIGVKDVPVGEAIGLLAVLRDPFQRRTSGGVSNQTTA